jgi:hypothetical protein
MQPFIGPPTALGIRIPIVLPTRALTLRVDFPAIHTESPSESYLASRHAAGRGDVPRMADQPGILATELERPVIRIFPKDSCDPTGYLLDDSVLAVWKTCIPVADRRSGRGVDCHVSTDVRGAAVAVQFLISLVLGAV